VLGVGWNLGVVGASALLTAVVAPQERALAEGLGEAAMGVAAAVGAPVAGLVLAARDLPAVWLLTSVVGALALATTVLRAGSTATSWR
jgi:predicted MFS family arabinose efflux permease